LKQNSICDVPGLKVGHFCNRAAKTGCTVILPKNEAVAGVDVRGSAPGTREIELLKPVRLVQKIHAVLLAGGSAFGLDAASGAQKYLEEQGIGFRTDVATIPIVSSAVIYDLGIGDASIRPNADMGYKACQNAKTTCEQGAVGVGVGATVGKAAGQAYASQGGVGTSSELVGKDMWIGVLTVVNSFGEIIDLASGEIIAGVLNEKRQSFIPTLDIMKKASQENPFGLENTTLSVVATNVALNREQATKVAQMAQDGLAKTIRPSHTMYDGDIVFALSTGDKQADVNMVGGIACELVAESILRGVRIK
jgi:L-aminopeptidase/D-esterase-like protein